MSRRKKANRVYKGHGKVSEKRSVPHTVYVKVNKYISIEETLGLRWMDTVNVGAVVMPQVLFYEKILRDYCREFDVTTTIMRVLFGGVWHETRVGKPNWTIKQVCDITGIHHVSVNKSVHWLAEHGWIMQRTLCTAKGKRKHHFITANGQSALNHFHAYCIEQWTLLLKRDVSNPINHTRIIPKTREMPEISSPDGQD